MVSPPRPPAETLRASEHRKAFLEHNLATRHVEAARALFARERRYFNALIPDLRGKRVLDLACGSGIHSLAWAGEGTPVVGIDFDAELLLLARGRLQGQPLPCAWACGDATRLPFRDRSFDVCYANSLVEHVPAWRDCLAEAVRVLRPGGMLVLYTTNRDCPVQAEVRGFPFYSWLPEPVKRRMMGWIMEHRRDLVNYTDFPAVNWFTFPRLRRALRELGAEAFDRLDLQARRRGGPLGALLRASSRWPALKWPYRLYAVSIGMYAVRRG